MPIPWAQLIQQTAPGVELFDAHTHVGRHDPDGFTQTFEELLAGLDDAGARGCFVFPFHEPDGYRAPNDAMLAAAAEHPGRLVPFCRVDPWSDPLSEAERCLDRGARGIKLHPRAERFAIDHPAVPSLFALAQERTVPILIHSGRGIAPPGAGIVDLAQRFPGARVILAHAGASDLAWIWRAAAELPNLLFDTAWWLASDLLALFSLVPPGQILFASDAPYGRTGPAGVIHLRLAVQAGLSPAQLALIASGTALAIAAGEPPAVAGPAVGEREVAPHLLLNRVADLVGAAMAVAIRGGDPAELVDLARLACAVPEAHDDFPLCAAIARLIADFTAADPTGRGRIGLLALASCLARTPDVPLPAL